MANIQFYAPGNMQALDWTIWDDSKIPIDFSSTEIEFETVDEDGNVHIEYSGSFGYEYYKNELGEIIFIGVSSGTLTDYVAYDDEIIEFSVEDFSFDAVAAFYYMRLGNIDKDYNTEFLGLILSGDDTITGSYFDDLLRGFDGNDTISGGERDDKLFGDAGKDQLFGGSGQDKITGGAGKDLLTGGIGDDTFIYANRGDGGDKIEGFFSGGAGGDTLAFASSGFGLPTGALKDSRLQRGASDDADSLSVRFIYNRQTGDLFFDNDGNGGDKAVLIATLTNLPHIVVSDFIII